MEKPRMPLQAKTATQPHNILKAAQVESDVPQFQTKGTVSSSDLCKGQLLRKKTYVCCPVQSKQDVRL